MARGRVIRLGVAAAGAVVLPGATGVSAPAGGAPIACVAAGPEYYAFELVGTKNVPGTGVARGRADVSAAGASPFSVSLAPDGSYRYDVRVQLEGMRVPRRGVLVAWVTTNDLAQVQRLGALDADLRVAGSVSWNKFIVVVTLEARDDPAAPRWAGPVAFRGMSRSGMMHTMAGHGALQEENCAAYGYDD